MGVSVVLRNHRPEAAAGSVRYELPRGWRSDPAEHAFHLDARGTVTTVHFDLQPPKDAPCGDYRIAVAASGEGWRSNRSVRTIEYDHIGRTYVVAPSEVRVVAFPWAVDPVRVGYVASGFDSVPEFLEQMGFNVTLLGHEDLLLGDLAAFDTIVLGVYAYRSRPDLVAANQRLLRYVEDGGHLVVQLHRPGDNWDPDTVPPYRLVIGQPSFNWRITDESAPVTVLQPNHRLFNAPNRISESDWGGWRKDRGLYFPMEWATEYQPLLSMSDPGWEPMQGGMLLARYGKGTYLYTSLILYYQLEQYVPGAFRLMANMVSYPAGDR
ncbi:NEW3 domain-containing protein [Limnochorda pilosa]|uniref:NEW3 domain-containing protein n=1 Tax=Limnochorda pilosa TaxID=1555112 RepID=UPI001E519EDF|nr:NEW3 domain-containing protein [Limnochorda pilosa]